MPKWLAFILACLMKLWGWTIRVKWEDRSGFLCGKAPAPAILALWHNRLLFFAPLLPKNVLKSSSVLISSSRDGEYVSTFIRFFGLNVIRGSSSRGGVHAIYELMHALQEGLNVALTVDGPRGPRYTPHAGCIALAQKCGAPIITASVNARHRWELKSWDRLQIPMPFSSVTVTFGEPFSIPSEMPMEEALNRLTKGLMAVSDDER